jgi:hypothetical protein
MAIIAYSVTKKKKVPMLDPKIDKNGNRYMASGKDKDGNKLTLFMSEADAKMALKLGHAKKGKGF